MLTAMSETADTPAFVTKVGTGMADATPDEQRDARATGLARADAQQLAEQIEDVAKARMRARAASRHAYVG